MCASDTVHDAEVGVWEEAGLLPGLSMLDILWAMMSPPSSHQALLDACMQLVRRRWISVAPTVLVILFFEMFTPWDGDTDLGTLSKTTKDVLISCHMLANWWSHQV